MEVKIKPATIKNLKDVQNLTYKLLEKDRKVFDRTLNCRWPFSKHGTEFLKNMITKKNYCTFIALVGKEIVGYITGYIGGRESYRKVGKFAVLGNIFILEQYRNLGIGKKLCRAFFNWCKKNEVKMVRTEAYTKNNQAIHFYKHNGFVEYTIKMERVLK